MHDSINVCKTSCRMSGYNITRKFKVKFTLTVFNNTYFVLFKKLYENIAIDRGNKI